VKSSVRRAPSVSLIVSSPMDRPGGASSLGIVTAPVTVPPGAGISALTAAEIVTPTVSSGSSRPSPTTENVTGCTVSPGSKVRVPVGASTL